MNTKEIPRAFQEVMDSLRVSPCRWLVTGAAGFIGSNLVQFLLQNKQTVVGLDDFSTGFVHNLEDIERQVDSAQWSRFRFVEGSIEDLPVCRAVTEGVRFVLHEAAFGSVPRSIEDPIRWNAVNVNGFLNAIVAARDAKCERFVYASSSSVYGDDGNMPKRESVIGTQLSPYAVSKFSNELYAHAFFKCYGLQCVGLRYFNVFGPRQDPEGAYAAVVPRWITMMLRGEPCTINGTGEITRDFCYIENVIQANLLAAVKGPGESGSAVFNVGVAETTNLVALHKLISEAVVQHRGGEVPDPIFGPPRHGDIQQSLASIERIRKELGYEPTHTLQEGLQLVLPWYQNKL